MIELKNIVKQYGHRIILRKLSVTIHEGDFVTLMGANGVGKTTLLHLIASLSKPTSGQVLINGYDLAASASQLRRFIGLVSHKTLLYDDLTAWQNLQFYAKMYDVTEAKARSETLLNQVGLWGRHNDLVRTYSRGMQQRLAIARALLHNPPILLLDEPDTGLDQRSTARLADLLATVGTDQRTIVMTTHNFAWGLEMGQRILILAKGKVAYDAQRDQISADSLKEKYDAYTYA